jgi:hypothetical protein
VIFGGVRIVTERAITFIMPIRHVRTYKRNPHCTDFRKTYYWRLLYKFKIQICLKSAKLMDSLHAELFCVLLQRMINCYKILTSTEMVAGCPSFRHSVFIDLPQFVLLSVSPHVKAGLPLDGSIDNFLTRF